MKNRAIGAWFDGPPRPAAQQVTQRTDPLSTASSSSHRQSSPVNDEQRRDDGRYLTDISEPNHRSRARRLRRLVLEAEQRIRTNRPSKRSGPAKPDGADLALAQLAAVHQPGDGVGQAQMVAAGIPRRPGGPGAAVGSGGRLLAVCQARDRVRGDTGPQPRAAERRCLMSVLNPVPAPWRRLQRPERCRGPAAVAVAAGASPPTSSAI